MQYGQCMENKMGTHHSILGKRPSNNLNVGSIPIKRVRTASRQRVISGNVHAPNKNDASSGDTNSYQDDQRKNFEVDSVVDFEKQLPFDCGEVSTKPKKKKKAKHLVYQKSIICLFIFLSKSLSFFYSSCDELIWSNHL